MTEIKLSAAELAAYLAEEFPEAINDETNITVETVSAQLCRLRQRFRPGMLRPGRTVSGPTMMNLADIALYAAVLARVGRVALAVTTNFSINFLRKPPPGHDLIADASLLKLGKRLAVGEVGIYSSGVEDMVAHVVGTYAIPERHVAQG